LPELSKGSGLGLEIAGGLAGGLPMAGGLASCDGVPSGDGLETAVTLGTVVGVLVLRAGVTVAEGVAAEVEVGVPDATIVTVTALVLAICAALSVAVPVGVLLARLETELVLDVPVGVGVLAVAKSTAPTGVLVAAGEPATVNTDCIPGDTVRLTVAVGVALEATTTWAWAGAGAKRRQSASSQPESLGWTEPRGSVVAVALGVAVGTAVVAGPGVRAVDTDEPTAVDELGNAPVNRGSGGATVGDAMTIGRAPLPSAGT
jgi:hypothetical protein